MAWSTAAARPDLVRTLTTVSVPHPAAFARSMLTSGQALRSWYVLAFQPPGVVEALARVGAWPPLLRLAGLTAAEVRRFQQEIVEDGALPGALAWYRALPFDTRSTPGAIQVPTTHVWSDGDIAVSRRGAELTAAQVDAPYRLHILAGVDHWIPTHAPKELADIIVAGIAANSPRSQP